METEEGTEMGRSGIDFAGTGDRIVVVPPNLRFCFPWFQLPAINQSLKILSGKFQKSTIHKF